MALPRYTREDMMELARESAPGSIPAVYLKTLDYSPKRFREFLLFYGQKDAVKFLFDTPIEEMPPLVPDKVRQGYLKFRMAVGK